MNSKPSSNQSFAPKPQPKVMRQSPVELGGAKSDGNNKPLSLSQHLDGALNFIADSLFGGSTESPASDNNSTDNAQDNNTNLFAKALKQEQEKSAETNAELKKQKHLHMHKEMQMKEIFDLDKKKSEETIKQIKNELSLLIKEIKNVDQSVQTAVFQEEVDPGTYHVNFFVKLRNFLILLRRRVKEGATWMQTWHGKKQKSKFMQNSAKYGSKYMFGQEGQGLSRQTG